MESERPDDLDRLLDDGLASYSGGEPWPGLDDRVLRRVRGEGRPRRHGSGVWAIAALALVVLLMVLLPKRSRDNPQPVAARTVEPVIAEPAIPRRPRAARSVVAARAPAPRHSQFPIPTPPTAEERALITLVERYPAAAVEIAANLSRVEEPIQIEPIHIDPLHIDEEKEQR